MNKSPYQQALALIEEHKASGQAYALAKLILSLWSPDCPFSFRECAVSLAPTGLRLAVEMITEFARTGETDEVQHVGRQVYRMYPDLWKEAQKMTDARVAF